MSFDADSFLNQTVTSPLSTSIPVCPEGEYRGIIQDLATREFTYKSGDRAGMTGVALDLTWEIQDEALKTQFGFAPKVRQSFLLDFTESGGLDAAEGKNVGLGRVREAVRQNKPGQPWSPNMLRGQGAIVLISHRMDGDNIYADVKKVRAA